MGCDMAQSVECAVLAALAFDDLELAHVLGVFDLPRSVPRTPELGNEE